MAHSRTEKVKVIKHFTKEVEEKLVVLTLTQEEAKAIKTLVGNIVGFGKFRDLTKEIYYALECENVVEYDVRDLFTPSPDGIHLYLSTNSRCEDILEDTDNN